MSASAHELHPVKTDSGVAPAEAKMSECQIPMPVDVHSATTYRADAVSVHQIKHTVKTEYFPTGSCPVYACVRIIETFQPGWNAQKRISVVENYRLSIEPSLYTSP